MSDQLPLSGPHLAKEGPAEVLPFGGLTKEQLLMVHPDEAQRDIVMWVSDILERQVQKELTDNRKRELATKIAYWTRLFHCQGALMFQQGYEKKIRELAEKRRSGKIAIPRKTLMVPFKYKGKTK